MSAPVLAQRRGTGPDTCSLLEGMFKRRDWSDYKMQTRPISESPVVEEEEEREGEMGREREEKERGEESKKKKVLMR